MYHQHLQQQQQYQQYQQRLQQQLQQERLLYEQQAQQKISPSSSHAARDYDIKRKLSAKQRERHDDNAKPTLTGQPGTVKQRVKERKHAMKDAEVIAKLRTICTEADPTLIYSNMRKIGQG